MVPGVGEDHYKGAQIKLCYNLQAFEQMIRTR